MRQKYLRRLPPLEARLEQLPMMESLAQMIEQAGHEYRAYRVLLLGLLLVATGGAAWLPKSGPWLVNVKNAIGVLLLDSRQAIRLQGYLSAADGRMLCLAGRPDGPVRGSAQSAGTPAIGVGAGAIRSVFRGFCPRDVWRV